MGTIPRPVGVSDAEMRTRILECRAMAGRHPWERTHSPKFSSGWRNGLEITWVCPTCLTERNGTWSTLTGELLGGYAYSYVDGYKEMGDGEDDTRLRVSDFRVSLIRDQGWQVQEATTGKPAKSKRASAS